MFIALVMIRISLRLIRRSHDYLVGAWVSSGGNAGDFTQPFRAADEEKVRAFLLGYPGVTAIRELLYTFVGPGLRLDRGTGRPRRRPARTPGRGTCSWHRVKV